MLKDVLKEISKLSGFSKSTISKNLNIPIEMVDDLINQLIRMGYLDEVLGSPSCETSCGSCPYARSCNTTPVKMYKITHKGNQLLKNI